MSECVIFLVREPIGLLLTASTRLSRNAHEGMLVLGIQASNIVRRPGYLVGIFIN